MYFRFWTNVGVFWSISLQYKFLILRNTKRNNTHKKLYPAHDLEKSSFKTNGVKHNCKHNRKINASNFSAMQKFGSAWLHSLDIISTHINNKRHYHTCTWNPFCNTFNYLKKTDFICTTHLLSIHVQTTICKKEENFSHESEGTK